MTPRCLVGNRVDAPVPCDKDCRGAALLGRFKTHSGWDSCGCWGPSRNS